MARAGRPKYTPKELEIIRNSVVRNGDTSYVPRETYEQIERDRPAGRSFPRFTQPGGGPDNFPRFTQPGGGPDNFPRFTQPGGGPYDFPRSGRPAVGYDRPGRGRTLDEYRDLLGRLEKSRGKTRRGRGSSKSRSYDRRKAEADQRQAEYRANQDRYRGDFTYGAGGGAVQQVVVPWYNPETGARWSAPNPGYVPKEGTGWVKGYGPKNATVSGKPVASTKETPNKGKKFETMLRARMGKF